jgi:archaemetzincin
MKNTLVILFMLVLISYAKEYKNKQALKKRIDVVLQEMKKENLDIANDEKSKTENLKNENNSLNTERQPEHNSIFPFRHYYIRGLGEIPEEDLASAQEIIENFFGYECTPLTDIPIPESCFDENGIALEAEKSLQNLRSEENTIYLTTENLYNDGQRLRGFTHLNGKTIIVSSVKSFMQETLIHEIGHTLGLDHCSDLRCIMAINNDEQDSGDFCYKCKTELHNKTR